jgi:hypothetical protein
MHKGGPSFHTGLPLQIHDVRKPNRRIIMRRIYLSIAGLACSLTVDVSAPLTAVRETKTDKLTHLVDASNHTDRPSYGGLREVDHDGGPVSGRFIHYRRGFI